MCVKPAKKVFTLRSTGADPGGGGPGARAPPEPAKKVFTLRSISFYMSAYTQGKIKYPVPNVPQKSQLNLMEQHVETRFGQVYKCTQCNATANTVQNLKFM